MLEKSLSEWRNTGRSWQRQRLRFAAAFARLRRPKETNVLQSFANGVADGSDCVDQGGSADFSPQPSDKNFDKFRVVFVRVLPDTFA